MKIRISKLGVTIILTAIAALAASIPVRAQDGTDTDAQPEVETEPGAQSSGDPEPELIDQNENQAAASSLLNGGFEGEYAAFSGFSNALTAPDWLPWWVGRRQSDSIWANVRPTFMATSSPTHSGEVAQRYMTEFGTHRAGVLQRVEGVTRGDILEFGVWLWTWSSNQDDPCCSLESGLVTLRVGIDPTGGGNPFASSVLWSNGIRSDDAWTQLSVSATAVSESVTVFVSSVPKFAVKHNEVYLDDATLAVIGSEPLPPEYIVDPSALEAPLSVSEPFEPGAEIVSGPLIYSVQSGDTLSEIARLFEISVADLADANGLDEDTPIFVAGQLVIPGLDFVAPATVVSYTLQPNDTLEKLAIAFNTNLYTIAQLNGIVNYQSVETGTEILVPVDTDGTVQSTELTEHLVQPGETLSSIALLYDVSPQTIVAVNNLETGAQLTPGQTLIIP